MGPNLFLVLRRIRRGKREKESLELPIRIGNYLIRIGFTFVHTKPRIQVPYMNALNEIVVKKQINPLFTLKTLANYRTTF